jgi:serine/threonine-protein kinase
MPLVGDHETIMNCSMLRIRHRDLTTACLALLLTLTPLLCVAQSAGNKAAAEAIFEQGKLLMQSGDYTQACLKFEASQKLDEGIGTLLYLADCYEKTGRTASAWAMFKEAASRAGAQGEESRQKLATQRARSLEPGLVKITIDVAKGDESMLGFEVRNDGVAVPAVQYGAPFPIDPGEHRIEASAPGKRIHTEVINVTKGVGRITIPLLADLAPPASATPSTPTPTSDTTKSESSTSSSILDPSNSKSLDSPHPSGKNQRTLSYVLGSVGIVGVGVGSYFGLAAIHSNSQSKSACNGSNANDCYPQSVSLHNDALSEAKISTVAFVAGGVLLAAGAVFYFTAPDDKSGSLHAGVALSPNATELSLGGAW